MGGQVGGEGFLLMEVLTNPSGKRRVEAGGRRPRGLAAVSPGSKVLKPLGALFLHPAEDRNTSGPF